MNDQVIALISAVVLAAIVRFFNVVLSWLAKVLHVEEPDPIQNPASLKRTIDHTGTHVVEQVKEAPDPNQSAPIKDQ